MASTPAVLSSPTLLSLVSQHPTLSLPVLVPNPQGLSALTSLLSTLAPSSPSTPVTNEIAVFVSATESFSRANLNSSRRTSIERLVPVVQVALARGMTVRGYVSVVAGCPFEGRVEPKEVRSVVGELLGMGCYEVSLGDTIGVGTPSAWRTLLAELAQEVPVEKLAVSPLPPPFARTDADSQTMGKRKKAHCHDTYGTSIASILTCLSLGIRTVDSSIAGLGGCPYSPGATGNVATEDVVYALESSGYSTGVLPVPKAGDRWDDLLEEGSARGEAFARLAEVGEWVSGEIRRENASRAGRAGLARMRRGRELRAKL